jgi:uncharacterized protein (TIGR01319 family)
MRIDAIVYEIGSTTTVVSAFDGLETDDPKFLGQGFSKTTVLEGDVNIGIQLALAELKQNLGTEALEVTASFACSSAAGGLRMSVHGLVLDMTVRAAREAALGAGANLHFVTSGFLSDYDLLKIQKLNLNIIMIAGGVDFGESATALYNASQIASLRLNLPVIYSGNIANHDAVKTIFEDCGQAEFLFLTENVYPKIDVLQVDEVRKVIQKVFEKHITKAPGMRKLRDSINSTVIPTPGAVMEAAILLQKDLGDLVCVDIGGATTDVHSVSEDSLEISKILINPEPFAKRTVEGDLGLFINKDNVIELIGKTKLLKDLKIAESDLEELVAHYQPIPDQSQIPLTERLAKEALAVSLERHAGKYQSLYGTLGKSQIAEGKDLTNVKYFIATGGALTRLPHRQEIIREVLSRKNAISLLPKAEVIVAIDNDYIMAALGVLSKKHPIAALKLLKKSLGIR